MAMSARFVLVALLQVLTLVSAWEPPVYGNFTRQWSKAFVGKLGQAPDPGTWNVIDRLENFNNEYQRYTNKKANIQFSGQETLQIVPQRDSSAPRGWTSARLESKYAFTPTTSRITRFESSLRIAGNPQKNKQGIWPAFWLLGDSYRTKGVKWPECGEIDILENINGQPVVYGVVHCDKGPGGACNEPNGLVNTTPLLDNKFHVWRVDFNRTVADYKLQSITWYTDGKQFHRITGADVGSFAIWQTLAHSPMFMILNVAVGGDWSGPPNADTLGGTGSSMEVGYVAHYVSVQGFKG